MFDGLGVAWCAILWTNKRRRELKLKSELGRERKRKAKKKKMKMGHLKLDSEAKRWKCLALYVLCFFCTCIVKARM